MIVEQAALMNALDAVAGECSLVVDCGRGATNASVHDDVLSFEGLSLARVSIAKLKEDVCYLVTPEGLKEVSFFGDDTRRYYKLHATGSWPTVEISSTPMHRHSDITPEEDTRWKVTCISPVRGVVLDTCCGLGYTAILAAKHARLVHTFEIDPNMVRMMRYNPWSRELFEKIVENVTSQSDATAVKTAATATFASDATQTEAHRPGVVPFGVADPRQRETTSERRVAAVKKNIVLHEDDVCVGIARFPDSCVDRILHDPPTFKYAGELYSLAFYKELRRVLKRDGILYHYTPSPGKQKGRDFVSGVLGRLKQAGFTTRYVREASGIVAR